MLITANVCQTWMTFMVCPNLSKKLSNVETLMRDDGGAGALCVHWMLRQSAPTSSGTGLMFAEDMQASQVGKVERDT